MQLWNNTNRTTQTKQHKLLYYEEPLYFARLGLNQFGLIWHPLIHNRRLTSTEAITTSRNSSYRNILLPVILALFVGCGVSAVGINLCMAHKPTDVAATKKLLIGDECSSRLLNFSDRKDTKPVYKFWTEIDGDTMWSRFQRYLTTKVLSNGRMVSVLGKMSGHAPTGISSPFVYWLLEKSGLSFLAHPLNSEELSNIFDMLKSHNMSAGLHVCGPSARDDKTGYTISTSADEIDADLNNYRDIIVQVIREQAKSLSFVEVDVCSLVPRFLLPRLANIISASNINDSSPGIYKPTSHTAFLANLFGGNNTPLTSFESHALVNTILRIRILCQCAMDNGVDIVLNVDDGIKFEQDQMLFTRKACELITSMATKSTRVLSQRSSIYTTHSNESTNAKRIYSDIAHDENTRVYKQYTLTREGTQMLQEDVAECLACEGVESDESSSWLGVMVVGGIAGQDTHVENSYLKQITQIVEPLLKAQETDGIGRIGVIYTVHSVDQCKIVTQSISRLKTHNNKLGPNIGDTTKAKPNDQKSNIVICNHDNGPICCSNRTSTPPIQSTFRLQAHGGALDVLCSLRPTARYDLTSSLLLTGVCHGW
eukprot:CFRG2776T1